ncbi:glutamate 5-kinase [Sphingomicrobium astaxanthinifaciens]|uniref:glutamate 5-kinase n=1 Tax=Sphingomicrobium astaxanthinifaciens TaxID=1227949 RepID=UPI001FCA5301|nr:glutamate 5-kinase [Sphingomicrobium astaxanthinifaciens]MCJ7420249.1 glutamate 5-kinase [Sphingomicrobium astaxanthinifaciens]
MSKNKRIVIKVGSGLVVSEETRAPRFAFLHGLMADIAELRAKGHEVVLTSSGAAAIGLDMIGIEPADAGLQDKQAAAACGQPLIINAYKQVALEFGIGIAQVLLTSEEMENRRRYLNTKNTIERLLKNGILPIVNENDTVTTKEIRVGDNDRLAAKVAQMIHAEEFVMLTDIDGLYDRPPHEPGARFVPEVTDVADFLDATTGKGLLGSGGMLTKMQAANMAQNAGASARIAEGIIEAPISSVLSGRRRHTHCLAHGDPQSAWRVWLTDRLQMAGSVTVTAAAAAGLRAGTQGIGTADLVATSGEYQKGDVLHVYDEQGTEIGRGLTNFSSNETMLLVRCSEEEVSDVLGYDSHSDIIADRDFALLGEHNLSWDRPAESELASMG